ncbi:MAG: hypothetical protein LBU48_04170, partial [Coriobacteriales bacterium]|nr:hypothetical protein [Coriobacteriales bacterium]
MSIERRADGKPWNIGLHHPKSELREGIFAVVASEQDKTSTDTMKRTGEASHLQQRRSKTQRGLLAIKSVLLRISYSRLEITARIDHCKTTPVFISGVVPN